jgi:hypothetical protein
MLRPHLLILLLLVLQAGCTSSSAPIRFPGFESSPPDSLAIVRDSPYVYLRAVDGREFKRGFFDVGEHSYEIPAGLHRLTVYGIGEGYDSEGKSQPYETNEFNMHAILKPGHTYTLGAWHHVLLDDTTQQPIPPIPPTTRPTD